MLLERTAIKQPTGDQHPDEAMHASNTIDGDQAASAIKTTSMVVRAKREHALSMSVGVK